MLLVLLLAVQYVPPHARVTGAPPEYVEEMRAVVKRVDAAVRMPALAVVYRECGEANAFFYPSDHALVICHELWDARRTRYRASGLDEDAVEKLVRDAMTFTFFHELAHAVHHELELPIVGSTEDAADEIATLWMIRFDLADLAEQAARSHAMRSADHHDPWDDHGSGPQRGFAIACVLYGADPQHRADIMDELHVPAARRAQCASDHPRRLKAWTALFLQRRSSMRQPPALHSQRLLELLDRRQHHADVLIDQRRVAFRRDLADGRDSVLAARVRH
jgi:hypothetical protein